MERDLPRHLRAIDAAPRHILPINVELLYVLDLEVNPPRLRGQSFSALIADRLNRKSLIRPEVTVDDPAGHLRAPRDVAVARRLEEIHLRVVGVVRRTG